MKAESRHGWEGIFEGTVDPRVTNSTTHCVMKHVQLLTSRKQTPSWWVDNSVTIRLYQVPPMCECVQLCEHEAGCCSERLFIAKQPSKYTMDDGYKVTAKQNMAISVPMNIS